LAGVPVAITSNNLPEAIVGALNAMKKATPKQVIALFSIKTFSLLNLYQEHDPDF